ncbi:MAG: hypothetical protein II073_06590 [Lachnospiraceae bacterium]|nr:hypothetical protein [Lachnospiraceae bacterium]
MRRWKQLLAVKLSAFPKINSKTVQFMKSMEQVKKMIEKTGDRNHKKEER